MQRYSQQIIVPQIGTEGQQQIAAAKVLVIGAGGLGTPTATYLAAAGVGTIGIMDGDVVAVSNLARQFQYNEKEKGQAKAPLLAEKLLMQNPAICINPLVCMLTAENAEAQIAAYDIVCDCTDNADARLLIDAVCGKLQKPLVFAAVKEWEGYVAVLHHRKRVALSAIFSYADAAANCSVAGIVNTACGFAGTIQATETIKIILGQSSALDGGLLCFNLQVPVIRVFRLNEL